MTNEKNEERRKIKAGDVVVTQAGIIARAFCDEDEYHGVRIDFSPMERRDARKLVFIMSAEEFQARFSKGGSDA